MRVATETYPYAKTTSISLFVDTGSRYEDEATNGVAHFLEHLSFKGTKNRSREKLEVEIENHGAHLNAYTTREQTVFFSQSTSNKSGAMVDIIAYVVQNSIFSDSAVERERSVILQEAQEVNKIPEEVVLDHLHATAFQKSPLGHTILGPISNIRSITRDDIVKYVQTHYVAPRMVLVGAGDIEHGALVKMAEKAFGSLPTEGPTREELLAKQNPYFTGSDVRIREPDMETCNFAVAFEGLSHTDPDLPALMLLQKSIGEFNEAASTDHHKGSTLASRLAYSGLASSMFAFATPYHDTGLFGVFCAAKGVEGDGLQHADINVMRAFTEPIYDTNERMLDNLTRARNQLKSAMLAQQGSMASVATDIGTQLLTLGRRMPKEEMFARLDAVNANKIKAVAERVVFDKDPAVAAFGETFYLNRYCDYNWIKRRSYQQRY